MRRNIAILITLVLTSMSFSSCTQKDSNAEEDYYPGDTFTLHWSDEFDGDSLDENTWNRQIVKAGRFNEEWQRYTDSEENAYVENGTLVIAAMHESDEHGLDQYTSARLNTAGKFDFKYGKVAARIKLPYSQGIWPAFWMLGSNIDENGGDTPWPASGEIDILELYGSKSDSVIEANIHFAKEDGSHGMMGAVHYQLDEGRFADDFHIFELEWNEQEVMWYVDGVQYANFPIDSEELAEFHKDFFFLFNIAVGGTWAGYPDESTVFPQFMIVDWVRVYKI